MLRPREAVRTLPSYHPPLAGRDGLRLDFNENTVGCSPRVLERLRRLGAEDFARYPEREPVEAAVAEMLGVDPTELLLTNGVDEAIHLLCQTYLEPDDRGSDRRAYVFDVPHLHHGCGREGHQRSRGRKFPVSDGRSLQSRNATHAFDRYCESEQSTGTVAPERDLLQIARSAPGAAVLVDEAYFEFYGQSVMAARESSRTCLWREHFPKHTGWRDCALES